MSPFNSLNELHLLLLSLVLFTSCWLCLELFLPFLVLFFISLFSCLCLSIFPSFLSLIQNIDTTFLTKTPLLIVLPHFPTNSEFGGLPVCFKKPIDFFHHIVYHTVFLALVCKGLSLFSVHSTMPTSYHTAQQIFVEVHLSLIVYILETFSQPLL